MRHSLACFFLALAYGEQLPIRNYTTVHGLAGNSIHRIRNGHGLLWFATTEGLSRFDGVSFSNYGTAQGLPDANVYDFLAAGDGSCWVATAQGLCRYHPAPKPGQPRFTEYALGGARGQRALVLAQDRQGVVWCGAARGLYRLRRGATHFETVDLGPRHEPWALPHVGALYLDRRGILWIGSGSGLYRSRADGLLDRFTRENGLLRDEIQAISEDRTGVLWVGTDLGLSRLVPDPSPGRRVVERHYSRQEGLPDDYVQSLFLHSSGRLWTGTLQGMVEVVDSGKAPFRAFGSEHGLSSVNVETFAEDSAGNLWIGAYGGGGAMKFALRGITNFTKADGLASLPVIAVFESRQGHLCAVTRDAADLHVNCFDGGRFRAVRPRFPGSVESFGGGWGQIAFQDRAQQWWFATGSGLIQFPRVNPPAGLAGTGPGKIYQNLNSAGTQHAYRIFEDSSGAVWGAGSSKYGNAVFRVRSGRLENFSESDGLPSLKDNLVASFAESPAGQIWLGYDRTGLVRYRDGGFERVAGLPAGGVWTMLADRAGRLWAGLESGGLARLDRPDGQRLTWIRYTTAEGLSSNRIHSLAEDSAGQIYAGTGHGVDQVDPANGRVRHYTAADGLLDGDVIAACRDRHGALWFATHKGLSRLVPQPEARFAPADVYLTALRVSGNSYPLSDLGESRVEALELAGGRNNLEIEFAARDYTPGNRLRYQHRLEGSDSGWSHPSESRSLHLAGLAPGNYRLLIRAVEADGMPDGRTAALGFKVVPPVWRRWWFLLLSAAVLSVLIYSAHRYRLAHALALERVRTRIAADLHDDIGSSLSHIAILSELAGQKLEGQAEAVRRPLSEIEQVSRGLVDSMSDIVWAIDPRKDHLRDLSQRMRRWASDILTGRNIDFTFHAPAEDLRLDAEMRREVFLVFKEAVHNLVKHSRCTAARIELRCEGDSLVVEISDNGAGFTPEGEPQGHGLRSMRTRASRLGGEARIDSNGKGTSVRLRVPLRGAGRALNTT
jgi:signal transduction histidine kinase/ligand-binding sensor domain-containing protein